MEKGSRPPNGRPSRAHRRSPLYLATAAALGSRVRALRRAKGLTLQRAAESMDVDLKHLQKIEAGQLNVTLVTLLRLASGLDTTIAALFRLKPAPLRSRSPRPGGK